jgi:hypothetical protein
VYGVYASTGRRRECRLAGLAYMVTGGTLVAQFTVPVEHGVMYIRDKDSTSSHLVWDPASSAWDVAIDSLAIAVQAPIDGLVAFEMRRGAPDSSLSVLVFEGALRTPSGYLVIHDADQFIMMTILVDGDLTELAIRTDVAGNAGTLSLGLT